jgi:hypothetical protein
VIGAWNAESVVRDGERSLRQKLQKVQEKPVSPHEYLATALYTGFEEKCSGLACAFLMKENQQASRNLEIGCQGERLG